LGIQETLNLAIQRHQAGDLSGAEALYRQVLASQPNQHDALHLLGTVAYQCGKYDTAINLIRRAISMRPAEAVFYINLGLALAASGQIDAAVDADRQATELQPNNADALCHLAGNYLAVGCVPEAIDCWRRAIEARPNDASAGSNRLFAMSFDPRFDAAALLREHNLWSRRHADPLASSIRPHQNVVNANRRLRIGYLSPDLRIHVVGLNLLPLLSEHDHSQFEIFCYSAVARPDELTERLRSLADQWRDIRALSDDAAAELIRQDQIDILIDLAQHTNGNRILIFARKPAPVQVSYLGYLGTTGLSAIDYRFSDPYIDPPGAEIGCYAEETWRLPKTYWAYQPRDDAPEVTAPPAESNGFPTFGCLNHFCKMNDAVFDLWAKVLHAADRSRMLIYSDSRRHRQAISRRFASRGISPDRLEFVGRMKWSDYLRTYQRIDMVLDTFPFAGGITTCDSLWMGVPVVTYAGQIAVGRGSSSVLSNVGLADLIAATPDEYVNIAANWQKWISLRPVLRKRMQDSPLLDRQQFARDVEAAFQQMWTNWCGRQT